MASWRRLEPADGLSLSRFLSFVALFSVLAAAVQIAMWLANAVDYVGVDPDDTMRLVEVRDYLGGQGWFDLNQYRLGPEGGTLMHWSRLIDWPIATLITLYGQFLAPQAAEAAALATWPLLLILPLLASTALASYRLGGKGGMVIGLILALVFLAAIVRFRPGAIDHHNVQLVLVIFIAAMIIDPLARASNFAAAAVAGAIALAIGAETTPLVAVAAMTVAILWALRGGSHQKAAAAFGLGFALSTAALFLATTPPRLWGAVTCDTLSLSYLALASLGGLALAGSALLATDKSAVTRFGCLAGTGVVMAALAAAVSPQCLRNPLSDLDPLLKTYWISSIGEAQSIAAVLDVSPENVGTFYAVGIMGAAVCLVRILRRDQTLPHAVLFGLIATSWMISAIQVRGMIFANFLAFVPLSALVADLRSLYLERRKDMRAVAAFVVSALFSVPSVWTVVGVLAADPINAIADTDSSNATKTSNAEKTRNDNGSAMVCLTEKTVPGLVALPAGRVLASFNEGPALLRFTSHSVLTANYHRNQRGMVAALRIGMARPQDALSLLEAQNVRYILLCDDDLVAEQLAREYPAGLYAALRKGDIPGYLEEIPRDKSFGLEIYQLIQR